MNPIIMAIYRFALRNKNKPMNKDGYHFCMQAAIEAQIHEMTNTEEKRQAVIDCLLKMLLEENK